MDQLKDVASLASGNFSYLADFVSKAWDTISGKEYNVAGSTWKDTPDCQGIFKKVDPETKSQKFPLTHERVYYQAQFHLCLYYSLVQKTTTKDFESIYDAAKSTEYWAYVDNSEFKTVGEYALLELCIDCVMLKYLLPHLSKTRTLHGETDLEETRLAQVFELIYFRLLRHLCSFIEAYAEIYPENFTRIMMTVKTARFLLTRSLTRQTKKKGAGNENPRLGHPIKQDKDKDALQDCLLKESLKFAVGDEKEIDNISEIKKLHFDRMSQWYTNVCEFRTYGGDKDIGLTTELKLLEYLLEPTRFPVDKVYYHVHKRAYYAIALTQSMVEKVCGRLYPTQEQLEDEELKPDTVTGERVFNIWKGILLNTKLYFKHFET